MTPLVTVVTPAAPYHAQLVARAAASVTQQTVPCAHVVIIDHDMRGTGWARNAGLAQVDTPFVVFLDADDEIAPTFVERALAVRKRHRYVYCDWMMDDERRNAPDCAWRTGTWHTVTTLLPSAFARAVGGFDETLPAAEDTEFYVKLNAAGYCGQRLAEPLAVDGSSSSVGMRGPSSSVVRERGVTDLLLQDRVSGVWIGQADHRDAASQVIGEVDA
jgi:hypothetical protein